MRPPVKALSESKFLRLFAFSALYFAQGVPWGFIAVGYVVFMSDQGLSGAEVGHATAMAYLPWTFKVLGAPLIDWLPVGRWGFGRRRPYIVAAEFMMGASLFYLGMIGDLKSQLGLVTAALFVHNTFAALQDVASDALAVDLLEADERALANSLMWASKVFGITVGGGAGVYLAKLIGWPGMMMTMGAIMWLVMLVPLLLREHAPGSAAATAPVVLPRFGELKATFSFPATWLGFAIAFGCSIGHALVPAITTRALRVDLHYSEEQLAQLTGVVEPVTGAVGALLGGLIATRFGLKPVMMVALFVMALMLALFGASAAQWGNFTYLIAWDVVYYVAQYAFQAASLGFLMTLANPAIGATHFALYMAASNLALMTGAKLGGVLADDIGVANTYYVAGALELVSIALVPLCNAQEAERRFHAHLPEAAVTAAA
jgi:PAT family beta-lactamase induction signal transducer AmpG